MFYHLSVGEVQLSDSAPWRMHTNIRAVIHSTIHIAVEYYYI